MHYQEFIDYECTRSGIRLKSRQVAGSFENEAKTKGGGSMHIEDTE
jgi:hypothetical protein